MHLRARLHAVLLVVLAATSVPVPALAHGAADPGAVTVGPGADEASWQGVLFPASFNPAGCLPAAVDTNDAICDHVALQVDVEPKFWGFNSGGIEITIEWADASNDFDLYVYDADGNEVASAASGGGGPETVAIPSAAGGYEIRVLPWMVTAGDYTGTVTFTSADVESAPVAGFDPSQPLRDLDCVDGHAGPFPCDGVRLDAFVPLEDLGAEAGAEASDIWGWTDPETQREYAIVGLTNGTAFVDVTDALAPQPLGVLPNPSLLPSIWHDIKVYDDHAYIVSESDLHDLQVFDLTRLRGVTAPQEWDADGTLALAGDAHNIGINEQTGRAYIVGSHLCDSGPVVFDLTGTATPGLQDMVGCILEDGYTHDIQCVVYHGPDADHDGEEICLNSNEDTLTIVEVTDPAAPTQLSRTGYDTAAYTHQGWLTEDHRYFLLGDELDEQDGLVTHTTTYIWDVSDLESPVLVDAFEHETSVIDHNMYVRDGLVYQSNYQAGLRILSLAHVAQGRLDEVAWFDTYPAADDANFNGTWSNYPYFTSGTIPVTGIEEGLFLLRTDAAAGAPPVAAPAPTPADTGIVTGEAAADGSPPLPATGGGVGIAVAGLVVAAISRRGDRHRER